MRQMIVPSASPVSTVARSWLGVLTSRACFALIPNTAPPDVTAQTWPLSAVPSRVVLSGRLNQSVTAFDGSGVLRDTVPAHTWMTVPFAAPMSSASVRPAPVGCRMPVPRHVAPWSVEYHGPLTSAIHQNLPSAYRCQFAETDSVLG